MVVRRAPWPAAVVRPCGWLQNCSEATLDGCEERPVARKRLEQHQAKGYDNQLRSKQHTPLASARSSRNYEEKWARISRTYPARRWVWKRTPDMAAQSSSHSQSAAIKAQLSGITK